MRNYNGESDEDPFSLSDFEDADPDSKRPKTTEKQPQPSTSSGDFTEQAETQRGGEFIHTATSITDSIPQADTAEKTASAVKQGAANNRSHKEHIVDLLRYTHQHFLKCLISKSMKIPNLKYGCSKLANGADNFSITFS